MKNGLEINYREPKSYINWLEYTLVAFDNSGKPTIVLMPYNKYSF